MLSVFTSTGTVLNPQVTDALQKTLTDLLQLVLLAVSTGVGLLVKNYLNSSTSGLKKVIATRLVKFAEQRLVGNDQKLTYVTQELKKAFPRIDKDEIHHLVEEAVVNMNSQIYGTSQPEEETNVKPT